MASNSKGKRPSSSNPNLNSSNPNKNLLPPLPNARPRKIPHQRPPTSQRSVFSVQDSLRKKVVVPVSKPYITFQGAGRDVTVIEWHDRASDRGPDGQQLRTYHTASVSMFASYFSAKKH